jgi:hypothetical protein
MARFGYICVLGFLLFSTVKAGHCVDETNNFIVTNFEIVESASFPGQAMATISGYFEGRQYVNYAMLDYTLDGDNWMRSQLISHEEFEKDHISHFTFNLSIDQSVTSQAQGVFSVVEDTNTVWCDLVKFSSGYSRRRLVS